MSYSATFQAATKHEARERLAAFLDKTIGQHPEHAHDRKAIVANADAALDLMADDPERDVWLSVAGSLTWRQPWSDGATVTGVHVSASATLVTRA